MPDASSGALASVAAIESGSYNQESCNGSSENVVSEVLRKGAVIFLAACGFDSRP